MNWDKKEMQCRAIGVTVPLDTILEKAVSENQAQYTELISHIQNDYAFSIKVVVIGTMGAMPKILDRNLQKIPPPQ